MTIIVPTLAVSFAAFCVWLSVRIMNRRSRWAKGTFIGLFILVMIYPASVGPICWLMATPNGRDNPPRLPVVYWPLGQVAANGPDLVYPLVRWWMRLGVRRGSSIWVPTNSSNTEWLGILK